MPTPRKLAAPLRRSRSRASGNSSAERLEELESAAAATGRPPRSIVGSARIVGELSEGLRELSQEVEQSLERTARLLEEGEG